MVCVGVMEVKVRDVGCDVGCGRGVVQRAENLNVTPPIRNGFDGTGYSPCMHNSGI